MSSQLDTEQDRKKNIIEAVRKNDIHTLQRLVNSPEWYQIRDFADGLLHVSIMRKSKEAFDYLLSLPNFPLEMVGHEKHTPLSLAVRRNADYYAIELIKKGANVFYLSESGRSTIFWAAQHPNIPLVQLLMENGVDLDSQDRSGVTPLHRAINVNKGETLIDIVSFLLYKGANPHIPDWSGCIPLDQAIARDKEELAVDILFYYTFDRLSVAEMSVDVFLTLAKRESPLVYQIDRLFGYSSHLFSVDVKYLKLMVHKFADNLEEILPVFFSGGWPTTVTLEKLDVFLDSDVSDHVICGIQKIKDDDLFTTLIFRETDESQITNIFCYLLSYGLNITESGLKAVYRKFGFCELFEILLHMDIEINSNTIQPIIPSVLYDVTRDVESYLENSSRYLSKDLLLLTCYFSSGKLVPDLFHVARTNTKSAEQEAITSKIIQLSSAPLLVQLARDVFRKYFIRSLKIKNSRQFYTNLERLQIGEVYKRIITFQKKLYD